MRAFRYIYVGLSWAIVAAVVVQVFFAGLMAFGVRGGTALHADTGWIIHSAAFLLLVIPALARAGRNGILFGISLFAAIFVQPLITFVSESAPFVAALHPVNALLIFWLSLILARHSLATLRSEPRPQPAA